MMDLAMEVAPFRDSRRVLIFLDDWFAARMRGLEKRCSAPHALKL
jgi:hypothetical protein